MWFDRATGIFRIEIDYIPGPRMLPPRLKRSAAVQALLEQGLLKVIEGRNRLDQKVSYIPKPAPTPRPDVSRQCRDALSVEWF